MGWGPLPRAEETLPEILGNAGYTLVVVVDTPFFVRQGYGHDRGFRDFEWIPGQRTKTWGKTIQSERIRGHWGSEEDCFAPKTMITAEKRLEHFHEDKLFLYVDTWDPHEPWEAPSWYVKAYYPDYAGQIIEPCYGSWHRCGLEKKEIEIAHACYRGEITMVDRWIGHLLENN